MRKGVLRIHRTQPSTPQSRVAVQIVYVEELGGSLDRGGNKCRGAGGVTNQRVNVRRKSKRRALHPSSHKMTLAIAILVRVR
jgi:hypothetical protein